MAIVTCLVGLCGSGITILARELEATTGAKSFDGFLDQSPMGQATRESFCVAALSWIVANIHRIMILSGVLTMTMVYAAIAPEAALRSTFGESIDGPVADVVVRNWGALIALMGALLIYGARNPAVRPVALIVAVASKATFGGLVLSHGIRFLGYQAGVAVVIDLLWVAVFALYLLAVRRVPTSDPAVRSTVGV